MIGFFTFQHILGEVLAVLWTFIDILYWINHSFFRVFKISRMKFLWISRNTGPNTRGKWQGLPLGR